MTKNGKDKASEAPENPYLDRVSVSLGRQELESLQRLVPSLVEGILDGTGEEAFTSMVYNWFLDNQYTYFRLDGQGSRTEVDVTSEESHAVMAAVFSAIRPTLYDLLADANRAALHRFIFEDIGVNPVLSIASEGSSASAGERPQTPVSGTSSTADDGVHTPVSQTSIGVTNDPSSPELTIHGGSGVYGSPYNLIPPTPPHHSGAISDPATPAQGNHANANPIVDHITPSRLYDDIPGSGTNGSPWDLCGLDSQAHHEADVFSSPPATSTPVSRRNVHSNATSAPNASDQNDYPVRSPTPGPSTRMLDGDSDAMRNATPGPSTRMLGGSHPNNVYVADDSPTRHHGNYGVRPQRVVVRYQDRPFPVLRFYSPENEVPGSTPHTRSPSPAPSLPGMTSPSPSLLALDADIAESIAQEEAWAAREFAPDLRSPPPSQRLLDEDDLPAPQWWYTTDLNEVEALRALHPDVFDAEIDAIFGNINSNGAGPGSGNNN